MEREPKQIHWGWGVLAIALVLPMLMFLWPVVLWTGVAAVVAWAAGKLD